MRTPQGVIKSHCDELEYFQRRLWLKDNGTNTEEIPFLLRYLEKMQSDMKDMKDFGTAPYNLSFFMAGSEDCTAHGKVRIGEIMLRWFYEFVK